MTPFHTRRTVYGACGRFWAKAPDTVNEGLITASNIHPCGTCLKVGVQPRISGGYLNFCQL